MGGPQEKIADETTIDRLKELLVRLKINLPTVAKILEYREMIEKLRTELAQTKQNARTLFPGADKLQVDYLIKLGETALANAEANLKKIENLAKKENISESEATDLQKQISGSILKIDEFYSKRQAAITLFSRVNEACENAKRISEDMGTLSLSLEKGEVPEGYYCPFVYLGDDEQIMQAKNAAILAHNYFFDAANLLLEKARNVDFSKDVDASGFLGAYGMAESLAKSNSNDATANIMLGFMAVPKFGGASDAINYLEFMKKSMEEELRNQREFVRSQLLDNRPLSRELEEKYGKIIERIDALLEKIAKKPTSGEEITTIALGIQNLINETRKNFSIKFSDKYSDLFGGSANYEGTVFLVAGMVAAGLAGALSGPAAPFVSAAIMSSVFAAKGIADVNIGKKLKNEEMVWGGYSQIAIGVFSLTAPVGNLIGRFGTVGKQIASGLRISHTLAGTYFSVSIASDLLSLAQKGIIYGWSNQDKVAFAESFAFAAAIAHGLMNKSRLAKETKATPKPVEAEKPTEIATKFEPPPLRETFTQGDFYMENWFLEVQQKVTTRIEVEYANEPGMKGFKKNRPVFELTPEWALDKNRGFKGWAEIGTNLLRVEGTYETPGKTALMAAHEQFHYLAERAGGWYGLRWKITEPSGKKTAVSANEFSDAWLHEGMTELNAQRLIRGMGYEPQTVSYAAETLVAVYLEKLVGPAELRKAYLSGDMTRVREIINTKLGENVFEGIMEKKTGAEAIDFIEGAMDRVRIDYTQDAWVKDPVVSWIYLKL